jgi:hypothetical protein
MDRDSKDLDIFVLPEDISGILEKLAEAGYATELTVPHWLGKVFHGPDSVDVIFSSGNGIARVDKEWFEHAVPAKVLGLQVQLCPPEETIWSKAFVMERERYDGADVAHLLRARGRKLDWPRLLKRFGPHWRPLLSHLILFGYIYPDEASIIPDQIIHYLVHRLENDKSKVGSRREVCQGTLLSRSQYLHDLENLGYQDPRLPPDGRMTAEEVAIWTNGVSNSKSRASRARNATGSNHRLNGQSRNAK